jgi:hypothetical protein
MLPQNCFIFTKEDVGSLQQSQLFGYGITDDALIFGTDGLRAFHAAGNTEFPTEGRFAGLFITSDQEISIRADATGQELLYLYKSNDNWAVSSSFMLLAEWARTLGRLSLYPPAVVGFHLKNGVHVGEQLISHRTTVTEISVVPLTTELIVDRKTGALRQKRRSFLDAFSFAPDDKWDEKLIDVLERGAGIMGAIQSTGNPLNLFLSGGYDSRLVLAMTLANGSPSENLRVSSHVFKKDDFQVASALCETLGLPLNTPGPRVHSLMSDSDVIRMYMLSCGATYLPFYPVSSHFTRENAVVRLTGDQPTGWTFFDGKARFNGNANKIATDIEEALSARCLGGAVKNDFLSVFSDLEIEHDHPAAMLANYCAIRSRHHCGRNWYRSTGPVFLFTPLMQSAFVGLDLMNAKQGHHTKKLFADVFSAFGGWAIETPFETPDRDLDAELIDNSVFRGGVKITPKPFRVFGKIEPSRSQKAGFLSVDFNFDSKPERLKPYLTDMFYRTDAARQSGLFSDKDIADAKMELQFEGQLSHNLRKLSHLISTNKVLEIVDGSGVAR